MVMLEAIGGIGERFMPDLLEKTAKETIAV